MPTLSQPRCRFTLQPGASATPPLRAGPCRVPDVQARCRPEHRPTQLGAGRRGRAHPALPMGRRRPPSASRELPPTAAAPAAPAALGFRNLLFCVCPCKIRERNDLRNGCVPFKICPLPFPFLPSAPFHRFVPKYRGRRGGKESSTLSKGRNLKGEIKRERGLGECHPLLPGMRRKRAAGHPNPQPLQLHWAAICSDRNCTRTKAHLLPSPREKGALPSNLTSGG
ncbi:uncharacterized protein LOC129545515 isoform X1 [Moschus berezovskii]|uniref:uncharacterized protein LOC129545515 isoform X1 n=1 Tax=Moschus berezovskii TaxID=68408 RepID=UPI0024437C7C|nr:uncharacterized protein LOC129545515 isoform X1 [Moschus berezovskii]